MARLKRKMRVNPFIGNSYEVLSCEACNENHVVTVYQRKTNNFFYCPNMAKEVLVKQIED